jgi:hypothetical protein
MANEFRLILHPESVHYGLWGAMGHKTGVRQICFTDNHFLSNWMEAKYAANPKTYQSIGAGP